jgi:hypothetical protein
MINQKRFLRLALITIAAGFLICYPGIASSQKLYLGMSGGTMLLNSYAEMQDNFDFYLKLLDLNKKQEDYSYLLFGAGRNPKQFDLVEKRINLEYPMNILSVLFPKKNRFLGKQLLSNSYKDLAGGYLRDNFIKFLESIPRLSQYPKKIRIYNLGHGNEDDIAFLKKGKLTVNEFIAYLDKIKPDAEIQVLMGQCHSGTFSRMIYKNGNYDEGFSPNLRCGFFSSDKKRTASVSNPFLEEDDEEDFYSGDYISRFFYAYDDGKNIADYNGDALVGGDEAHAFAFVNDISKDTPEKTSDLAVIHWFNNSKSKKMDQVRAKFRELRHKNLEYFSQLFKPYEKAIYQAISEYLGFSEQEEVLSSIEERINGLKQEESKIQKEMMDLSIGSGYAVLKDTLLSYLKGKEYGEIFGRSFKENYEDPEIDQKIEKMLKDLTEHEKFAEFASLYSRRYDLTRENTRVLTNRTLYERLRFLLTVKIKESLFLESAENGQKERYQAIKRCESSPFF